MHEILYNYDVYPKVFLGDREQTITIQPLGDHAKGIPEFEYCIEVRKVGQSNPESNPERSGRTHLKKKVDADGCLRVTAYFEGEGQHFIFLRMQEGTQPLLTFSVYSLQEDMVGRIPLRGDLHMHTCRSDGREAPAIVAANYRGHGYDFLAITDHERYYPSLEAMEAFEGMTDFTLVPGEEVQLPLNDLHYINFGGTYSINALISPNRNQEKYGDDVAYRSLDGNAPEVMSMEAYEAMIRERAKSVPRAYEAERIYYANLEWIYEHMQANDGLGIFVHPYWKCPAYQVPEDFTEYIYQNGPFDAFEVLGGENYFEHNGFQTGLYYEMKAKGYDYPVVGSTDSHGSTEHNENALICSTIVFAKENSRKGLVDAIKEKYSIAVDTISKEYRLVGDFRLMKYASFLMEHYFPLHDLACKAEGYYMKRLLAGDTRAEVILKTMRGQIPEMQKKYFAL